MPLVSHIGRLVAAILFTAWYGFWILLGIAAMTATAALVVYGGWYLWGIRPLWAILYAAGFLFWIATGARRSISA